jgi:hypothetical protein
LESPIFQKEHFVTVYYVPGTSVDGFTVSYGDSGGTATLQSALAFTFTGGYVAVGVQPSSPPAAGQTITFDVWSPAAGWIIVPCVQDTGWTFHYGPNTTLAAGWNTISYEVPTGVTVLTVGFQGNEITGTLLANNFGWNTSDVLFLNEPGTGTLTGNAGAAITPVQITDTDSAGLPVTFTATGLPAGLSISPSGLISGTPTTAGSYTPVVYGTDSGTASGNVSFTWVISATAGDTVTVANPGAQTCTAGTPFSLQVSASDSGSGETLTFTASGLPAGLSISSGGLISGTPTTAGSDSVAVTATDPTGAHGQAVFIITVSSSSVTTGTLDGGFSVTGVGNYELQVNEYDSSATLNLSWSNPPAAFTISDTAASVATNGEPAAYPSLYLGDHWGTISPANPFPVQVSSITSGQVTTTLDATLISGGDWDCAYDIWFVPTAGGNQNGSKLEMMIWLNHNGSVQPAGSLVTTTTIGGNSYNVWWNGGSTVTFVFASGVSSVTNLDLYPLIGYAVTAGYLNSSWYLIDVEAGFELWQGGTGLAVTNFSVNVGAGTPANAPSPPAGYTQTYYRNFATQGIGDWESTGSSPGQGQLGSGSYAVSGNGLGITVEANGDYAGLASASASFSPGAFIQGYVYLPSTGNEIANWPAFWAIGAAPGPGSADGEIDLVEGLGGAASWHVHSSAGGPGGSAPLGEYLGWHYFSALWDGSNVTFWYDDNEVGSESLTTTETQNLVFSVATYGVSWGNYGGPSLYPATAYLAWAGIWQS